MKIEKGVISTQTKGCKICFHIGTTAFYLGERRKDGKQGIRIEIFTPLRIFKIC
jgi:hypothetical protein